MTSEDVRKVFGRMLAPAVSVAKSYRGDPWIRERLGANMTIAQLVSEIAAATSSQVQDIRPAVEQFLVEESEQ
jgi:hypothetical protein